jgi:hypothetical protein
MGGITAAGATNHLLDLYLMSGVPSFFIGPEGLRPEERLPPPDEPPLLELYLMSGLPSMFWPRTRFSLRLMSGLPSDFIEREE